MERGRKRRDTILILTPVKDAEQHLDDYFATLGRLTYPGRLKG